MKNWRPPPGLCEQITDDQQDIVLDEAPAADSERDLIEKQGEEKNPLGKLSSIGDIEKAADAASSE